MANPAADALQSILRSHGAGVCDTPKVLLTLLRKHGRAHPEDVDALLSAIPHGVVQHLCLNPHHDPNSLARVLEQCARLAPAKAEWVVQTWVAALAGALPPPEPRRVDAKTAAAVAFAAVAAAAAYFMFGR